MKILNLKFSNINSLQGDSRIDFDQPPFAETGVFAITGPNGSGKTSILDAITLGLYGETFRFDRPAEQVMTKNTTECYAEVEFSIDDDIYRSSWYVNRENDEVDGALQEPEMSLSLLNGSEELLEQGQHNVLAKITNITGMNFRRFRQSIVLAQGEFAAFLNAVDSERLDVLEKLISQDIYTDFKQEIELNAKKSHVDLQKLQQEIAALDLMTPEQLDSGIHDFDDFEDQLAEFQNEISELQATQNKLANQQALQHQIDSLKKAQNQAGLEKQKQQSDLQTIAASTDVLAFKDEVTLFDQNALNINQQKQILQTSRGELNELQSQMSSSGLATELAEDFDQNKPLAEQKQIIDRLLSQNAQLKLEEQSETSLLNDLDRQITEKRALNSNTFEWLETHAKAQSLVDDFPQLQKLKQLRIDIATDSTKQKSFAKWKKTKTDALKSQQAALEKSKTQGKSLQLKLKIHETEVESLARGKTLEEIKLLYTEQVDRVKDYKELYALASASQKLTKEKFSWFGLAADDEPEISELQTQLQNHTEKLENEHQVQKDLEKEIRFQTLHKLMEKYRHELVDGLSCALCGADHHPFSARLPILKDPRQALSAQRIKVKELRVQSASISKQIQAAETKQQQQQDKQQGLKTTRSRWLVLCNKLSQADNLEISDLKRHSSLLQTEQTEYDEISGLFKKYQTYENNIVEFQQKIITQKSSVDESTSAISQLNAELQNIPPELIDLESLLTKCRQDEKQLSDKILVQLDSLGEKMPASGKEETVADKLELNRLEYEKYAKSRDELQEQLDNIAIRGEACRKKITDYQQQQQAYLARLKKEQAIGLQLAILDKQSQSTDQEKLITKQDQEFNNQQQSLMQKLNNSAYQNIDAARERLQLTQSQADIEQQLSDNQAKIDKLTQDIDIKQTQLQAQQAAEKIQFTEPELTNKIRQIKEKFDITNLEIKHIQQKLELQDQLQEQNTQLQQQVAQQQKITQACDVEVRQIDEENGNVFRRRVQQIMAGKFLQQANSILEKISGRYYVHQRECEHGIALEIEDTQQENSRRLPQSLSGGESFVVSLALALGLSELANNGKAVDSLFIDEGFGTLDPNTLTSVVNTLEDLQTHGKTIGVISHVEAVRKHFKTRIETVKKANGLSELKIPKRSVVRLKKLKPFRKG